MVMVRNFQNHRHSIAGEKKPSPFHRHEKLTIAPVYFFEISFLFKYNFLLHLASTSNITSLKYY